MSSSSSSDSDPSQSQAQASLLSSHAKYIQGSISSALGYDSSAQTKSDAVQEMKDASSSNSGSDPGPHPPAKSYVLGTLESAVGKVIGCEGMVEEGHARMPEKAGSEETSGTG